MRSVSLAARAADRVRTSELRHESNEINFTALFVLNESQYGNVCAYARDSAEGETTPRSAAIRSFESSAINGITTLRISCRSTNVAPSRAGTSE